MQSTLKLKQCTISCIDLNFLGQPGIIGVYLIQNAHGNILIESGPGSTIPALTNGLETHGIYLQDVSDIFLTHIHLDHAGGVGWLARQGIRIHVHPKGAPHLLNPEKLLASAAKIYGDSMESLWGKFLPVPPERLCVMNGGDVFEISGIAIQAIDTPGHADHHLSLVHDGVCFTGDVAGIRFAGSNSIVLPTPPPEFHLEMWRSSVNRLSDLQLTHIVPTHFGIYSNPARHFSAVNEFLSDLEDWMISVVGSQPTGEEVNRQYTLWLLNRFKNEGIDPELIPLYESLCSSGMSASGLQRYWTKAHSPK
jgi:glyoxylase-like metal-dependent hydrolase (beta-lactamase superfamily II)